MNKYEKMEIISFDDIFDVYDTIGIELMQLEDTTDYIAVYGKVDLIKELFTTMISDGYEFGYADFDALDKMRKDMVYMMFVRGDCVVSVEPAYSTNGVVMGHDAKVALFYMDDCDQDIIDYCVESDKNVILFDFGDDEFLDEDECDCCGCDLDECVCRERKCDCQKEDKPVVASKESYTINGKSVTKAEFDEKYKEIEEMHMDNIKDMLLRYCDFMDSMNELSKIFRW